MAALQEFILQIADDELAFLEVEEVDALVAAFSDMGIESLLDLRLWFDGEGEDLMAEIREFTKNLSIEKADEVVRAVVMHLRDMPLHVLDNASAPVPVSVRAPLRKRKLIMGRMVIDREAELAALSSRAVRLSPVLANPLPLRARSATARNVSLAIAAAAQVEGAPLVSIPPSADKPVVTMQQKESGARRRAINECFTLLNRVGSSSSRYMSMYAQGKPVQELIDVQEDLFMGRREPSVVRRYVKDVMEFLDWIESLLLALASVDSFHSAAWLRLQRSRGKSVPYRIWSAICWFQDCLKVDVGARERDVKDLAQALRTSRMSKSVQAHCIPVETMIQFESMACGAKTQPLQCFAGIAILCAYGLKRWSDVQFVIGTAMVLTDVALVVATYKSKRKDEVMYWVCPRRSVSGVDWIPLWLKCMNLFDLPSSDFMCRRISQDLRTFTNRPADWADMNRVLHAALVILGMQAPQACAFTMHSFRHVMPTCAFQLKLAEPEVKAMGQWGSKPAIARQYDAAMIANELAAKDWVIQNLSAGWRPVSAGYLPKRAAVPWDAAFAAPTSGTQCCGEDPPVRAKIADEAELEEEPPLAVPVLPSVVSTMRGWSAMADITGAFKFNSSVRQVVGRAGLVHLYCEDLVEGISLCKRWKCGSTSSPAKLVKFSEDSNEYDQSSLFGFCELCYSRSMASRIGTLKHPALEVPLHQPSSIASRIAALEDSGSSSSSDSSSVESDIP